MDERNRVGQHTQTYTHTNRHRRARPHTHIHTHKGLICNPEIPLLGISKRNGISITKRHMYYHVH